MPTTLKFFQKKSHIVEAGGPSAEEQRSAMIHGQYWTILNSSILKIAAVDDELSVRVSALKHALQTFGPISAKLPDLRANKGKAEGHVFHGHVNDSSGKTYVLEWAVVDKIKKHMTLIGFASHENYAFRQSPLTPVDMDRLKGSDETKRIIELVENKTKEVKAKAERMLSCS